MTVDRVKLQQNKKAIPNLMSWDSFDNTVSTSLSKHYFQNIQTIPLFLTSHLKKWEELSVKLSP